MMLTGVFEYIPRSRAFQGSCDSRSTRFIARISDGDSMKISDTKGFREKLPK